MSQDEKPSESSKLNWIPDPHRFDDDKPAHAGSGAGPVEVKDAYFNPANDFKWAKEQGILPADGLSWRKPGAGNLKEMARRKFTHERQCTFLDHYMRWGHKNLAAAAAGVTYNCVRECENTDKDFAEAVEYAKTMHFEMVEATIKHQAIQGFIEIRRDKDGNVLNERRILETRLREIILKRANPEYVETAKSEVAVTGGAVVVPAPIDSVDSWDSVVAKYTGKTVETTGQTVENKKLEGG